MSALSRTEQCRAGLGDPLLSLSLSLSVCVVGLQSVQDWRETNTTCDSCDSHTYSQHSQHSQHYNMNTLTSVIIIISLLSLSQLTLADSEEMSQPEQELLAKYLLQQLTSNTPDPILARLVGEEEAGEILAGEQSQTIATIVPAPPGLSTAGSKQHQTCEF